MPEIAANVAAALAAIIAGISAGMGVLGLVWGNLLYYSSGGEIIYRFIIQVLRQIDDMMIFSASV